MFDIGWQEIFIIAILALIVVGPKDLPNAVRTITQWVRKARSMAREFQGGVNEMVREAELDDIKKQISSAKNFDIDSELQSTIDPDGEIAQSIGMDEDLEGEETAIDAAKPVPVSVEDNRHEPDAALGHAAASSPADDDVMPVATTAPVDDKELGA